MRAKQGNPLLDVIIKAWNSLGDKKYLAVVCDG